MPHVFNLGKLTKKALKRAKRGEGLVADAVEQVLANHGDSSNVQPVVIHYEKKPKSPKLPKGLVGSNPWFPYRR